MKVLVIGQGAREHALVWKLAQSPAVESISVTPGNFGTGQCATNVALPVTEVEELAGWAARAAIDLTVVGPEAALAAGIVDAFQVRGLRIFGPTKAAAQLESSKAWAKAFMTRHGIPTAAYQECGSRRQAEAYLEQLPAARYPLVVKQDGLALGKGVTIAVDREAALRAVRDAFKVATPSLPMRVVIEAFLQGFEVSFLAISDGQTARPLACAHDYKRAYAGDAGPMTGGMGAYSPLANEQALTPLVMTGIIEPAIRGMAAEGFPYTGILYAGLMLTVEGPQVLEFNARFGDPEAQVLLPRWEDDLYSTLAAAAEGRLADLPPFAWSDEAACGVVLASAEYPDAVVTGHPISGLSEGASSALIFHGGTGGGPVAGQAYTAGGRVLTVVGRGGTPAQARMAAYEAIQRITFEGSWYRKDIGEPAPVAVGLAQNR